MPIRLGLVGVGKIARDQHLPVIRDSPDFSVLACASRSEAVEGVPTFPTLSEMLAATPQIDAVVICTPPQMHFSGAQEALNAGKHVFLEKPPCTTTAELDQLIVMAASVDKTLFQSWHSQFAPGIELSRYWLASRKIHRVKVTWREDVRRWHPGQRWLWEAGGFGVFDPGINAISILTKIISEPIAVVASRFFVPSNCQTPIAADVQLRTRNGTPINVTFDFRETGNQIWNIEFETVDGLLRLQDGGGKLEINGHQVALSVNAHHEYATMYEHFAQLIAERKTDADTTPFHLVADCFLISERLVAERFDP